MTPALGLRENWQQFSLLVLVNAFVGAMVGLERAVLPLLAEAEFGLAARSAALAFIVSFGAVKAVANLAAGRLGGRLGRRQVLLLGWLFGLPVPLLLIWAPSWSWVVFANVLLGINQGLCWSTTVIMKIDLVGPQRRGLAMGLNEFAGYLAVAAATYASGQVAAAHGLRPAPFYMGVAFAAAGFGLSLLFVQDTRRHVAVESGDTLPSPLTPAQRRTLLGCNQAGLVNNLNDGVIWGLLPILLQAQGTGLANTALVATAYPAVWGIAQLWTGALSDRWGRKWLIAAGMAVQGAAIFALLPAAALPFRLAAAAALGLGTAMVYPTLLAAVSDVVHPSQRAGAVGTYRLWRDLGYAFGALFAGAVADRFGLAPAVAATAALTLASGALAALLLQERRENGTGGRNVLS